MPGNPAVTSGNECAKPWGKKHISCVKGRSPNINPWIHHWQAPLLQNVQDHVRRRNRGGRAPNDVGPIRPILGGHNVPARAELRRERQLNPARTIARRLFQTRGGKVGQERAHARNERGNKEASSAHV